MKPIPSEMRVQLLGYNFLYHDFTEEWDVGDWTVVGKAIHIQSSLLQKWCNQSALETIREHP